MKKFSQIKKVGRIVEQEEIDQSMVTNQLEQPNEQPNEQPEVGQEGSEVVKFFSKLFESREMAHVYHLQVRGEEGSYAKHEALGDYYEDIVEIIDDVIEVYQGQYGIVDGYDIIDTSSTNSKDPIAYFEEIGEFIKHGKKCISEEDTHIHSLIDDISCLVYKTLFKLKFNK